MRDIMKVTLRIVRKADIDEMVRIERAITGSAKVSLLEGILHDYLERGDPDLILAAEVEDKLVGFLVGEIRPWEFGEDEDVAWIKVVGVDPKHQGQGIGKTLGESFVDRLRKRGIKRLRTLVPWDSGDLITYFKALEFRRSQFVVLERRL